MLKNSPEAPVPEALFNKAGDRETSFGNICVRRYHSYSLIVNKKSWVKFLVHEYISFALWIMKWTKGIFLFSRLLNKLKVSAIRSSLLMLLLKINGWSQSFLFEAAQENSFKMFSLFEKGRHSDNVINALFIY